MSKVFNANTIDAALRNNAVTDAVAAAMGIFGSLPAMATLVTGKPAVGGNRGNVEIPRFTSVASAVSNPTDFFNTAAAQCTIDALTATAEHLYVPGHVADSEAQGGIDPDSLLPHLMNVLAAEIWKKASSLFTVANYGAAVVTKAAATFALADLPVLAAALPAANRALFLSSRAFGNIANDLTWDGAKWIFPGFMGGVFEADMTNAGANIYGAVATPAAAAISFSLPANVPPPDLVTRTVPIGSLGVSILAAATFQRSTRVHWRSCEAVIGCAPAVAAQCKLISA